MAQQARAAARRTRRGSVSPWIQTLKGLGVAVIVTLGGVALFALLMQWIRPSEGVVRAFNQILKLASIAAGVWTAVGRGGEGGLTRGAAGGRRVYGAGRGALRAFVRAAGPGDLLSGGSGHGDRGRRHRRTAGRARLTRNF